MGSPVEPDEEGPTVGLPLDEFVQAFEDLHRMLGVPMPDALT